MTLPRVEDISASLFSGSANIKKVNSTLPSSLEFYRGVWNSTLGCCGSSPYPEAVTNIFILAQAS